MGLLDHFKMLPARKRLAFGTVLFAFATVGLLLENKISASTQTNDKGKDSQHNPDLASEKFK